MYRGDGASVRRHIGIWVPRCIGVSVHRCIGTRRRRARSQPRARGCGGGRDAPAPSPRPLPWRSAGPCGHDRPPHGFTPLTAPWGRYEAPVGAESAENPDAGRLPGPAAATSAAGPSRPWHRPPSVGRPRRVKGLHATRTAARAPVQVACRLLDGRGTRPTGPSGEGEAARDRGRWATRRRHRTGGTRDGKLFRYGDQCAQELSCKRLSQGKASSRSCFTECRLWGRGGKRLHSLRL